MVILNEVFTIKELERVEIEKTTKSIQTILFVSGK